MNRIISIITLIALITTFSFSQEDSFKLGIRTGFNLYNVFGYGPPSDLGTGFGGGAVASIPIASSLTFNPELNFFYRKLNTVNHDAPAIKRKADITELAIGIPAVLQYTPFCMLPLYLISGVQLDIPVKSEWTEEMTLIPGPPQPIETKIDRATVDFGILLGLGYKISPNFAVDFRGLISLTELSADKDYENHLKTRFPDRDGKRYWFQYGLGLSYFF
ncbi:MAG: PorT family protein [Fibromonadales bacterium]|nr:PorT family protein [Fibromonadales bacterium]